MTTNLVQVATALPNLTIPMIERHHPTGDYRMAQHAASNALWDQAARAVISLSGTGNAYGILQRNLRGEYRLKQLGSVNDVADLVGRDNMPRNWDGSTFDRGGLGCFQWRENIGGEGFNGPKQPANVSWYQARALAAVLAPTEGAIYLLSDREWEDAAKTSGRNLEYATGTGELIDSKGQALAHCSVVENQSNTIDVDDPRSSRTPEGIIGMTGNVWEWMDENPREKYSFGLRGGSYFDDNRDCLRVDFRNYSDPVDCRNNIGVRLGGAVPRIQKAV